MKNPTRPGSGINVLDYAAEAARVAPWQMEFATGRTQWSTSPEQALRLAAGDASADFPGLIHVDDRERFAAAGREARREAGDYQVEFRATTLDGQVRWFLARGRSIALDDSASPTHLVGVMMDIHERKVAQLGADAEAAQKRALLENLPDVAWMKDLDGRFIAVNRQFGKRFNIDPDRAPGMTDRDIYPPEKAATIRRDDDKVIASDSTIRYQSSQTIYGREYWVEVIKTPIHDAQGRVIGTVGASRDISLQKAAEGAERQASDRFRMLAELSSDWFWEQDSEYRFTHFTANNQRHQELGLMNLIGQRRWDNQSGSTTPAEWAAHRATVEAHLPYFDFEYDYAAPDGRMHRFSVSGKPVYDAHRNFSGYRGIGRDITQNIRDAGELRQLRRRVQLAQEGSHLSLWDTDLIGNNVYLSEGWAALLGTTPGETHINMQELMARIHPSDLPMLLKASEDVLKNRINEYTVEHRVRANDGKWKWIMSRGRVTERDASGRASRMSGTNLDITERKNLEASMRMALSETEALLETSPTALAVLRDRVILRCNRAMEQLFGVPSGGLVGQSTRVLFPDDEAWQRAGSEAYSVVGHNETFRAERELVRADGSHFWAVVAGRRVGGGASDVVFSYTDVTEQQKLAVALAQARDAANAASQAKSGFLATMSHEIRTPMNGVLGMLELLELSKLNDEQRDTARLARESASALLRLIDDILDFSKIEAGQLEIHPERVSLADVLRQSTAMYRELAARKGLALDVRIDAALSPYHLADGLRVSQIVNNLLSNAIKFTESGSVTLDAALIEHNASGERICIRVDDTGIGVSAEQQERLFKPFSQADSNTTRKYGGTGLGLSICARLAELMGGSIKMVSSPGKGTAMTLLLQFPVAEGEVAAPAPTVLAPPVPAMRRLHGRILVAEDHPVNLNLVMRQIRTLGFEADHAGDGVEALAKWQSGKFAMVLTDCHMPNMDGYQLAREIRRIETERAAADGHARHIPIIACTASALAGDAELCFAAGMDGYLPKPVGIAQLRDALERWAIDDEQTVRTDLVDNAAHGAATVAATAREATNGSGGKPASSNGDTNMEKPLDLSVLAQFTGGDKTIERDIMGQFLSATRDDANALRAAVAQGNLDTVTKAAHRVKGAARMMGAIPVADLSERIEHASKAGDAETVTTSMADFDREHARLLEFLAVAAA